jgi:2,3-bisphosphoglycerate-independent phosphoglycerate mutase
MASMTKRPLALVILDGWGYAPRTEGNAIALAHTPYYDEICRNYPMTMLDAAGPAVGQPAETVGSADVGHLNMGTGRIAKTGPARIKEEIVSGTFLDNQVLNDALARAAAGGRPVAILRLAKKHGLKDIFIHCILDGLDVPTRTADIYVEALEIKLADIGVGRIASLCGRFFAMDSGENWERTARAYTLLVHAEGERVRDPVDAVRNSFLRGITDEFISPIVIESAPDTPVATIKDDDLVIFFNHRGDTMRQLVRSISVPDETVAAKPMVETVCLTEYDAGFDLACAFRQEGERHSLAAVLAEHGVHSYKITEQARYPHVTHFFDGGVDLQQIEHHVFVAGPRPGSFEAGPESQSFKITDKLLRTIESSPNSVFVVNMPAADVAAETGDMERTIAAIQYVDTCLGGICEKMSSLDGVVMITSSHGNCEEMISSQGVEPSYASTINPVPFHYVDEAARGQALRERGTLADIAPTILAAIGIEKPAEMVGADLRETPTNQ